MPTLMTFFGSKAQTKLIQYLLENLGKVFNQAGLARRLNLSPSTIARVLTPLIEKKVIRYEQVGGQMKIIALNEEEETVKILIQFYEKLKALP